MHTQQRFLKIPPYPHLSFQRSTHPGICLNLFQPLVPALLSFFLISQGPLFSSLMLPPPGSFSFLSGSLYAVSCEEISIYFPLKTSSSKSCTRECLEEQAENALVEPRPMKKGIIFVFTLSHILNTLHSAWHLISQYMYWVNRELLIGFHLQFSIRNLACRRSLNVKILKDHIQYTQWSPLW